MRLLFVAIFAAAVAGVFGENLGAHEYGTITDPQDGQRYQVIIGIRPVTGEKYPEDDNKTVLVVPGDGIIWIDGQRFAISADNGNRTDARLVVVGRRHFGHRHQRPHRHRPSWNEFQQQLPKEHPGTWRGQGYSPPVSGINWWNANPPYPPSPPGGHSHNGINWWAFPRPRPPMQFPVNTENDGTSGNEKSKDPEIVEPSTEFPERESKYKIIDLRNQA